MEPSPEYLRAILIHDEGTGDLIWQPRPLAHFKNAHGCNIWNAKNAGQRAGTISGNYRSVRIDGRRFLNHRVAWTMLHGEWPAGEIDHINGDYLDNRPENLRAVTRQENARNLKAPKVSKGPVGVLAINGRWRASISVANRQTYLGTFDCIDDAIAARKAAEVRYGFHPNHGRAAA